MSMSLLSLQAVQPKAGTPGTATESAPAGSPGGQGQAPPGGGLVMFLPLLLIVPILFMSFRKQKKEQEARTKMKKGDRVLTNFGLYGELVEVGERTCKIKIAPGTTVELQTHVVGPVEAAPAPATAQVATAEKK